MSIRLLAVHCVDLLQSRHDSLHFLKDGSICLCNQYKHQTNITRRNKKCTDVDLRR